MNPHLPTEESLNWKREEPIDLPIPESEGRLAIRHQDWRRLKNRIQRVDNNSWNLSVVYSTLFGVAVSAGLSIIPLAATKDLPAWVTPLYICFFFFSLICALVFIAIDRKLKSQRHSDRQDMIDEMSDIEGTFIRKKGLDTPLDVSTSEAIKNPAARESEAGDQEEK
jgi:hypothetical protein